VQRHIFASSIALLVLSAIAPPTAKSNPERSSPTLVSFDELQRRLSSSDLRLLDVRSKEDFDKGHLMGAVWVDIKAVRALTLKPGGLRDRESWAAWIAPLGLARDTDVLIADGDRQLDAARLWWLLRYLGIEKAGLIDGNVRLWEKQGRPLTTDVSRVGPGSFSIRFQADRVANRDDVFSALTSGKARVVDARSIVEYTGERKSSKRGGHIPTACRLEWSDLVGKDGRFLGENELRSKVAGLGIKAGETVITHCQSGGRSSVDAFVLERLGFPTRNYYLGWSDWGNADDTPVVEGKSPGDAQSNR
jgi:thiosulfate/3-mercaptopyruvate sulfurtransferase